jgi:YaiO family outer membrane protein
MWASPSSAQEGGAADVAYTAERVSDGYGDWNEAAIRLRLPVRPRTQLIADLTHLRAFHESTTYVSLGANVALQDWLSIYVAGGGSSGAPILPRRRGDFQVGIGLSSRIRLNVGGGIIQGADPYSDRAAFASLVAYLPRGFVIEAGGRLSNSDPGDVGSLRGFGAITWMGTNNRELIVSGSSGEEGWQLLSGDSALLAFTSTEVAVSYRLPVGANGGVVVRYNRYANRFYKRSGPSLGLSWRW